MNIQRRSDNTFIIDYDDGSHYEGGYANNQKNGFGKMRWTSPKIYYEGNFTDNLLHGYGVARFYDDNNQLTEIYDGYWFHNRRSGKGKQTHFRDGKVTKYYDGYFDNDDWDGHGTACFYQGNNVLVEKSESFWKNNKRNGETVTVTYYENGKTRKIEKANYQDDAFADGVVENSYFLETGETKSWERITYVNGKKEGNAHYQWANGNIIDGSFHNDVWDGCCKGYFCETYPVEYLRSCHYDGGMMFENNRFTRQGQAKYITPDGTVYDGTFLNNLRNGLFTITYPDGRTQQRTYQNDIDIGIGSSDFDEEDDEDCLKVEYTGNDQYSKELQPYFSSVIGMHEVKRQLDTMYKRFRLDAMRQQTLGIESGKKGYYFIITGNPGTGKTTVARIIGKMLHDIGILPKENFVEVDRGKLVGQYTGETPVLTNKAITSARGGTLFIDEAYTLYKKDYESDYGREAIDTLLKDMEDHRGEYCVIMAGYADQMNDMIRNANPGLASRFDHKIEISDYTSEELADILVSMAKGQKFRIKKEARSIILNRISREKVDDTFDNARFARRLLDEAIEHQAIRLSENLDAIDLRSLQILEPEDFGTAESEGPTLEQILEKLNALTGLDSVKKEVNSIVNAIRIQNESRRRGLKIAENPIPLNMVFTGNPGTGKTTVARLLGQIYHQLGLLKRGDVFVECVRSELVGRYQGETALKVKEVVRKALGGILFIDEAYSLVNGENDSFGQEAVNTLVSEIENNRENLAVILAGYSREMDDFLNTNSGLRSRLSKIIEFPDYTADELCTIFHSDLSRRGYIQEYDENTLKQILKKEMQKRDFGNARGVRNLADRVIARHNERINKLDLSEINNDTLLTINDSDIAEM